MREPAFVPLPSDTLEATLRLLTGLAAESVPGASGAGVSVVDADGHRSVASSDPLVARADALQWSLRDGPCLTALHDRVTVRVDDAATEARWRSWCTEATALGVRSVLSVPLATGGTGPGAIKVYGDQPGVFDDHAVRLLELFAHQAEVLLSTVAALEDAQRTNGQLLEALGTRDVIGRAKGLLLARGAVDDAAAFALLVAASQRSNTKLREVARQLVAAATEPDGPELTPSA